MEINDDNVDTFAKDLKKVAQIDALILETKDMIKPLQSRLKQLKIEKKELEKEICPTMKKNDLRKAELPHGIIEYVVKQSLAPITQKSIKEKIIDFFNEGPGSLLGFNSRNPVEKGEELFDYIYNKKNRKYICKEELLSKTFH
jgi:Family of unknown function (DUF5760)